MYVFKGDSHKAPLGQTEWTVSLHADRIEAERKAGLGRVDRRSIPIGAVSTVAVQNRDVAICTSGGEDLVVKGVGRKEAHRAVEAIQQTMRQVAAGQVVTSPATPHPGTHHELAECPRCGADVQPAMRKCPYCAVALAGVR